MEPYIQNRRGRYTSVRKLMAPAPSLDGKGVPGDIAVYIMHPGIHRRVARYACAPSLVNAGNPGLPAQPREERYCAVPVGAEARRSVGGRRKFCVISAAPTGAARELPPMKASIAPASTR